MSDNYPVPAQAHEERLEIKKSRFIALAMPVASRGEAMARLEQIKQQHPDARHHCWAYLLGDPAGSCDAALNDDGEPAGTAGKPILNVLRHKGVGDVIVVVVRYFGGIKLGAGGLTRAYSSAAEAVMSSLPLCQHEPMRQLELKFDFSQEQAVRHWADSRGVEPGEVVYREQVTMRVQVPLRLVEELEAFCRLQAITLLAVEGRKATVLPPSG